MNESTHVDENPNQITSGKTRLRGQIKELEEEVHKLKNHPLLLEARRLKKENDRLHARIEEMEQAASHLVGAALELTKIVTRSFEPEPVKTDV
jgi:uncharacterized protein with PhoU and TrkA domain